MDKSPIEIRSETNPCTTVGPSTSKTTMSMELRHMPTTEQFVKKKC